MKKREDITSKTFDQQFDEIFKYLKNQSSQASIKLAKELDIKINEIKLHPKSYSIEPYLPTKRNLYRFALIMKSWKIIFKVTNNLLIFIGIIHTSRHPREIKKLRTNKYK